jgi:hypothetical protein
MALAAIPSNLYVTQGNQKILLQWDIAAGATSYSIERSIDNITYAVVATPAINSYLDTTVSLGVQYYYKIASVNGSGTSPYTIPQSIIATPNGEMSLGELRFRAQQRADRVDSNFISLPEWNSYINQSYMELYDLLVTTFEDYYMAPALIFQVNGTDYLYDLPNGSNYSGAPAFYKMLGVDLSLNTSQNAYVTIDRFQFKSRNTYVYPNSASSIYGVFNLQYRIMGNQIEFIPTPSASQTIRIYYIPRINALLQDTDITTNSISGWIEYVITDAAIKALQKEESDVSVLMAQKQALLRRIQESGANRDAGSPDKITDSRQSQNWGNYSGWSGPIGGW